MEKMSEGSEQEKPSLWMNDYSVGEVRLCVKTERIFRDGEELDTFLKDAYGKIKPALNQWSETRYGRGLFGGYSDGTTIRVQTGLHDLTDEDRSKIQEVTGQFNDGQL